MRTVMRADGTAGIATIVLTAALSLASGDTAADAKSMAGKAFAFAGDTLVVRGAKLRLRDIEAPGKDEACNDAGGLSCADASKAALENLVASIEVKCRLGAKVGHGYRQARCQAGGRDVALQQLEAGWARSAGARPTEYIDAEARARAAARGVWAR